MLGTGIHMCVRVWVCEEGPETSSICAQCCLSVFNYDSGRLCLSEAWRCWTSAPNIQRVSAQAHTCPTPLEHCCPITQPEILTGSQKQTHSGGMLWAQICNFPGTRYKIQSEIRMFISVIFPNRQPTLVYWLLTVNRQDYFKLELNSIRKNKCLWPVKNTNICSPGINFTCAKIPPPWSMHPCNCWNILKNIPSTRSDVPNWIR